MKSRLNKKGKVGTKDVSSIFSGKRSEKHTDITPKKAMVSHVEAEPWGGGKAVTDIYYKNHGPKP